MELQPDLVNPDAELGIPSAGINLLPILAILSSMYSVRMSQTSGELRYWTGYAVQVTSHLSGYILRAYRVSGECFEAAYFLCDSRIFNGKTRKRKVSMCTDRTI